MFRSLLGTRRLLSRTPANTNTLLSPSPRIDKVYPLRYEAGRRIGRLLRLCLTLAALYAIAAGFFFWAMYQKPETFSRVMKPLGATTPFLFFPFETMWRQARAGHVHPGDAAPDFTLRLLDSKDTVTLSSFRRVQPVVLVFGSYT